MFQVLAGVLVVTARHVVHEATGAWPVEWQSADPDVVGSVVQVEGLRLGSPAPAQAQVVALDVLNDLAALAPVDPWPAALPRVVASDRVARTAPVGVTGHALLEDENATRAPRYLDAVGQWVGQGMFDHAVLLAVVESKQVRRGLLPIEGYDQNRLWCAIVALAMEVTAWMQMLALNGTKQGAGNKNGCDYDCSPSLRRFQAPPGRTNSTSRPKPPGSTSSTKASGGYEPWPSPGRNHPTCPNNHHATPTTRKRRPPETTLGPPSHPDDTTTTSRRPAAATVLNPRGVKDRG